MLQKRSTISAELSVNIFYLNAPALAKVTIQLRECNTCTYAIAMISSVHGIATTRLDHKSYCTLAQHTSAYQQSKCSLLANSVHLIPLCVFHCFSSRKVSKVMYAVQQQYDKSNKTHNSEYAHAHTHQIVFTRGNKLKNMQHPHNITI